MKKLLLAWTGLLLLTGPCATAQIDSVASPEVFVPMIDSVASSQVLVPMKRLDRRTSSKAYRMTFVAVPLIVGGVVMMSYDKDFRQLRDGYASSYDHDFDDYLQYGPMALTYAMKACGYKSRNSWGRMAVSNAFSAGLMAIAVNSLKYSVRIERPDGSTKNSFPSGHTATAFMAATILHKEYGCRSPWFSILGYSMATVTGVSRQLNNRHWMSDVMVGAGIGILTTELGYFLADLIFKDRYRTYDYNEMMALDRYDKPSFLGINIGFSTILGDYHPYEGMKLSFVTGPTASVQGAWFINPYVGVGGRFSVSNVHVKINDVAQADNFESATAYAGAYFSYPVSVRWLVGSKLMGGYAYYKSYKTDFGTLGHRGGATFGTGLSISYRAYQNLGVRFTTDYDLMPPLIKGGDEWMHRLTFGLEVAAMF